MEAATPLGGHWVFIFAIVLSFLISLVCIASLASKDFCPFDSIASSLADKAGCPQERILCLIHHPSDNMLPSHDYLVRGVVARKTVKWKRVCLIPQGSSEGRRGSGRRQKQVDFGSSLRAFS